MLDQYRGISDAAGIYFAADMPWMLSGVYLRIHICATALWGRAASVLLGGPSVKALMAAAAMCPEGHFLMPEPSLAGQKEENILENVGVNALMQVQRFNPGPVARGFVVKHWVNGFVLGTDLGVFT